MKYYLSILILGITQLTFGQSIKYISEIDQDLSIQQILVVPLVDNVKSIYAKPLTQNLESLVQDEKQWELKPYQMNRLVLPEELEDKPEVVQQILKKANSDGLIAGRISKGPNGITIKLTLYSGKAGLPTASEVLSDFQGIELQDLKSQIQPLFQKLKAKIPYNALVLSRKGQLVTLNIGTKSGVTEGSQLTALQVIKIHRHPKYHFIVSTEAVVLGKIQIDKADDYISFGTIVLEKDPQVILANTKLKVDRFTEYPSTNLILDGKMNNDLIARSDAQTAFGPNPTEWVPESEPTFGKIGLTLGLGNYNLNSATSGGSASSTNPVIPSIHLSGEMWFDPHWLASLQISSYVLSLNNGLAGSGPANLNFQSNRTSLLGGYNFLVAEEFFGPKIQLLFGYSVIANVIDNSNPVAHTSTRYSGLTIGVAGSIPMQMAGKANPVYIGGKLNLFLNPSMTESPVSSGSNQNSITSFGAFLEYKLGQRMNLKSELLFDLISTSFSGSGNRVPAASSTSQATTTLTGGIEYLF